MRVPRSVTVTSCSSRMSCSLPACSACASSSSTRRRSSSVRARTTLVTRWRARSQSTANPRAAAASTIASDRQQRCEAVHGKSLPPGQSRKGDSIARADAVRPEARGPAGCSRGAPRDERGTPSRRCHPGRTAPRASLPRCEHRRGPTGRSPPPQPRRQRRPAREKISTNRPIQNSGMRKNSQPNPAAQGRRARRPSQRRVQRS